MAARRRARGLSREQLAARARMSPSAVVRLEAGQPVPVLPTLLLIGALYRLGCDDAAMSADVVVLERARADECERRAMRCRRFPSVA
jgi:transcriptional regulator with XRE-family HTH domain